MNTTPTKPADAKGVRQRRKEARPGEIVSVALQCFLENGFEATKLDDVARRAGVAKGTLYVYFETKEQLFRAVVQQVTTSNIKLMTVAASGFEGSVAELVPVLLSKMASVVGTSHTPAVARLILMEADRIPDLARIWFDEAIAPFLAALEAILQRGQANGEIRTGDTRGQVISILGPMAIGILFGQSLTKLGFPALDLTALAKQHAETVMNGLARSPNDGSADGDAK